MTKKILIIEDEETLRESLERVLSREGYDVNSVDNAEAALLLLEEESYDLILTDVILPGITGIELLKRIREKSLDQIVVVMTAFASLETAVESLRAGAYDYIIKPMMHEEVKQVVKNALKQGTLQEENCRLKKMLRKEYDVNSIIARSPSMQNVMNEIRMTGSDENIIILGERGTGKELMARVIHTNSDRSGKPFISLNVRTIPQGSFETEVFGEPKNKSGGKGLLEEAKGGSLFIREVGDLSKMEQDRLLSVFEKGEITFPDSKKVIKIDVRLIVASSKVLDSLTDGFLQRLKGRVIKLPPLRERREDIEPLTFHFVERFSREFCKDVKGIDRDALTILIDYDWPGNVRELQSVIERAVLITGKDHIGRDEVSYLLSG